MVRMAKPVLVLLAVLLVLALAAGLFAFWSHRRAMDEAGRAMAALAAQAAPPAGVFDPALVADLPEIAQRYFRHAIAPGTPLRTTVRLEMRGTFLLGDAASHQSYAMSARQVLAPPEAFVWMAQMRSGMLGISGSDALVDGRAWTRFWIAGLIPVVDLRDTPDLNRSALARAAMEAVWVPASLLPGNGVEWEQTGPDTARLTFATGIEPVELTLAPDGGVRQLVIQRWSDANPERSFRLQPFGGTVEAEARFGGFTIPSLLRMGNHFGTPDYLAFFQAQVIAADYL